MPSRSAQSKKGKIVALFDIGTSVVSGALVSLPATKDERPVILYTTHAPIPVQEEFEFKRFFQLVLAAFDETASSLTKARPEIGMPKEVHCFLSSPWYASQTRSIKLTRPKPFSFTKKFARELIERDLKSFEGTYLKNYSDIGSPVDIIENKIIEIQLNGYKTSVPFGKKARELAMHLYFSVGSHALLQSLEHLLHRSFAITPITFHSFAFASYIVAREIIPEPGFLLVDISGEMTDISIIKEGVLIESVSYPSGKNAIIRDLSIAFALGEKEVLSLLNAYEAGHLENAMAARVERVLSRAGKRWSRQFEEGLFQLSNHDRIPESLALSIDDDVARLFKTAIEAGEYSQYMRTSGKFSVILLQYETLRAFCKVHDAAGRDLFLMIEALFVNQLI
jgi:hypothetical protein